MSINGDGSPQVIVAHQKGLGNDGQLWYNSFGVGSSWAGDQQVANVGMSVGPALLVEGDILYLFHQGSGNDGQLWYTSNDGFNGWTGDQQVPNTGMSESPAAAVYPGSGSFAPFVFHQGFGNDGQLWYNRYNGSSWAGDRQVPNTGISGSPALAVYPPPGDSGPGDDAGGGGFPEPAEGDDPNAPKNPI